MAEGFVWCLVRPLPEDSDRESGFALAYDETNWTIVESLSEAEVDYSIGDVLVSIEGKPVEGLSKSDVSSLLVTARNIQLVRSDKEVWTVVLHTKLRADSENSSMSNNSRRPSDISSSYDFLSETHASAAADATAEQLTESISKVFAQLEPLPGETWKFYISGVEASFFGNHALEGVLLVTNYRIGFVATSSIAELPCKNAKAILGNRKYASQTIGEGFVKGVTGLFSQPFAGAVENGIGGFMKGMGKGLLGMAVRPVSGVVTASVNSYNSSYHSVEGARSVGVCAARWFQNYSRISLPLMNIEYIDKGGEGSRRLVIRCKDSMHAEIEFSNKCDARDEASYRQNVPGPEALVMFRNFVKDRLRPSLDTSFALQVPIVEKPIGWDIFDAVAEYTRMGVFDPESSWRSTFINSNYELIASYPEVLYVPMNVEDEDVKQSSEFRTKGRVPVLAWKARGSQVGLCRSSQPKSGPLGKRNTSDETLLNAISCNGLEKGMTIIDCRPFANAVANEAFGAGYEEMANYPFAELAFMDIGNIHEVRKSYEKFRLAMHRNRDDENDDDFYLLVYQSKWLTHQSRLLRSAGVVTEIINSGTSCLVHCSDGWDRTAQCVSLAQLCLDPYYRTLEGFPILIEKDWIYFGHKFCDRLGFVDSPTYTPDEYSPIFIQFLECVWQLQQQNPTAFEFDENYLIVLIDAVLSGKFGNFLLNTTADRVRTKIAERSQSIWSIAKLKECRNNSFEPSPDPLVPIFQTKALRIWELFYFRFNALAGARNQEHVNAVMTVEF